MKRPCYAQDFTSKVLDKGVSFVSCDKIDTTTASILDSYYNTPVNQINNLD